VSENLISFVRLEAIDISTLLNVISATAAVRTDVMQPLYYRFDVTANLEGIVLKSF
jgi:hypothetical protein